MVEHSVSRMDILINSDLGISKGLKRVLVDWFWKTEKGKFWTEGALQSKEKGVKENEPFQD